MNRAGTVKVYKQIKKSQKLTYYETEMLPIRTRLVTSGQMKVINNVTVNFKPLILKGHTFKQGEISLERRLLITRIRETYA